MVCIYDRLSDDCARMSERFKFLYQHWQTMASDLVSLDATARGEPLRLRSYGIGSAGCNMVSASTFPSVAFSTSAADVERSRAARKMVVTPEKLVGLYNTDPKLVAQMPSVVGDDILALFDEADVAYLMSGLGGVAGSLGTSVLGRAAKARRIVAVSALALPFSAESERRRTFALKCNGRIMSDVDLNIVFGNDALSSLAPHLAISKAFSLLNRIMHRPAMEIAMILGRASARKLVEVIGPNVDGRFGLGMGRGDGRVAKAVEEALGSPWFDRPVERTGAAIAVYSASDPWDKELSSMLEALRTAMPDARIAYGSYADAGLGDSVRLSLVVCREPCDR